MYIFLFLRKYMGIFDKKKIYGYFRHFRHKKYSIHNIFVFFMLPFTITIKTKTILNVFIGFI